LFFDFFSDTGNRRNDNLLLLDILKQLLIGDQYSFFFFAFPKEDHFVSICHQVAILVFELRQSNDFFKASVLDFDANDGFASWSGRD
jgi:hypothetical protein